MLAINVSESEMGTAQKMTFSVKDFFSKCARIRRKLRIWSHLLKKSSTENFIFCAVGLFLSEWVYIFRSKINANFTKKRGFFSTKNEAEYAFANLRKFGMSQVFIVRCNTLMQLYQRR